MLRTMSAAKLDTGPVYVLNLAFHTSVLKRHLQEMNEIERKIRQLERHARQLHEGDEADSHSSDVEEFATYLMPSDISYPADWTEFDNVYQAHCPKFR